MAGVELATAYVSLVVEGSKIAPEVKRRFGQVGKEADRAGRDSGKRFAGGFGSSLKRGAAALGLTSIGLGVAGLVKSSVTLEASYSKTMALVAASTGAPITAMKELDALAMKLGADTSFSANEAAGAMLELGKAGISTSDIMGGALKGTLLLAAAGGTDLATASTIASNAMNTFNLRGRDMGKIAAALAGGANASSASVQSLGEALSQVGPGATNAGLSLQQTVGVLSAFDAAGVKGSDAGTSLKTMLARLVPQTKQAKDAMKALNLDFTNADGSFVSITDVAGQLKDRLGDLSEEQRTTALTTIFGSDATRAATVLMNEGAGGVRKYIKATKDQAAADKLAKANMSGTAGAMERLSGSIETAQLALGKALAPTVVKVSDFLADDAVPAITGFVTGMQDGTGAGGEFADTLKDVAKIGKGVYEFIDSIPGPVKKFIAVMAVGTYGMSKLRGGVESTVTSLSNLRTSFITTDETGRKLGAGARNLAGAGGLVLLTQSAGKADTAVGALGVTAGAALTGLAVGGPIGAAIGAGAAGLYILGKNLNSTREEVKVSLPPWKDYATTLDGVSAATSRTTREMVYQRLEQSGLLVATRELGLTDRQAVAAMMGNEAQRKRLSDAMRNQNTLTKEQESALRKETGAIGASREAQLRKNIALAKNKDELKKARQALRDFMKEPASKRVAITGVEDAKGQLRSLRTAIRQVFAASKDLNNVGPGGIDVLLNPEKRATGGPVTAGQPYIVGEHRPELFIPNQNGRILSSVPNTAATATPSGGTSGLAGTRLTLMVGGHQIEGVIEEIADSRVDAHEAMNGQAGRAFG